MSEPAWVLMGPATPAITWEGNWAAGTAYEPGDVVRYQNVDFIAVRPSTGQPPSVASQLAPPGYGTSLPASPVDGQEAILVDSITNPSYQWRFRYNAGSSSAYKWEFVGGVPLLATRLQNEGTPSSTPVALVGPSVTLPRAGDYVCDWGASGFNDTVGCYAAMVLTNAGYTPAGGHEDAMLVQAAVGNFPMVSAAISRTLQNLTAGVLAAGYYQITGGIAYFDRRWMSVLPVRVS